LLFWKNDKKGNPESGFRFPFLLPILLFPNQIRNDNVPITIVFLVVESENVWAIAVVGNMLVYEEKGKRLWIGYPFNVCNLLKNRDL